MSELISGKEALIALANGENVEMFIDNNWALCQGSDALGVFIADCFKFRLKSNTIKINEISAPEMVKNLEDGDDYWHIYPFHRKGYACDTYNEDSHHYFQFGAWRTEKEVKQVVAALRQIFK